MKERKNRILSLMAMSWLAGGGLLGAAEEPDWQPLFDGESLEGWVVRGGDATYAVEGGAIVGTTVPNSSNTFLCTEGEFGDFILELEFKVDPRMNSGVQIRSAARDPGRRGRVFGYQVEIDPSSRAWSGGIYDEARRGWLFPLKGKEEAQKAFRQGEWNQYRIEAIGDSIRTWINGVPAADLIDSMTLSGFIALQVHGTKEQEPMQVRWRNIRLKDLGRHVWEPIFDGETLRGWHTKPGGHWEVQDGMIVGTSPASEHRHGLLVSDNVYDDFTARVMFKVTEGNSGFYFRSEEVDHPVGVNGFQAEIEPGFQTGGLYETGGRAWVVQPDANKIKECYQPQEWNEMTVAAHGGRIVVHLNHTQTAELRDDPGRREGRFALQLHGGQKMDVAFKAVDLLVPQKDPGR